MNLDITLTGVDEKTDLPRLREISEEFPDVEWGVLYSTTSKKNRYPSKKFINFFVNEIKGIRTSVHYCGAVCRNFIDLSLENYDDYIFGNRVQLNFNSKKTKIDINQLKLVLETPWDQLQDGIILQYNQSNAELIENLVENLNEKNNLNILYDPSGGRGIEQLSWPKYDAFKFLNAKFGFAGGINVDNVEEVCQHIIEQNAPSTKFWIDMESSLRDENDWFDLDKCYAILKKVQEYGRENPLLDL